RGSIWFLSRALEKRNGDRFFAVCRRKTRGMQAGRSCKIKTVPLKNLASFFILPSILTIHKANIQMTFVFQAISNMWNSDNTDDFMTPEDLTAPHALYQEIAKLAKVAINRQYGATEIGNINLDL